MIYQLKKKMSIILLGSITYKNNPLLDKLHLDREGLQRNGKYLVGALPFRLS